MYIYTDIYIYICIYIHQCIYMQTNNCCIICSLIYSTHLSICLTSVSNFALNLYLLYCHFNAVNSTTANLQTMGHGLRKDTEKLPKPKPQVCQKQFDVNSRTNNSHYSRPKARQRVVKRAGICSNGITRHVGSQLKGQAHVKQLFKAASTHSTRGLPAV